MRQKNSELGMITLKAFFDQFGSPSDKKVALFLEVLLEELYNAKTISILGESAEAGDQTYRDPTGGIPSEFLANGSNPIEPPSNLGDQDTQNH